VRLVLEIEAGTDRVEGTVRHAAGRTMLRFSGRLELLARLEELMTTPEEATR